MAVRTVYKKWEIVKMCLKIIEENCEIVKVLIPKERKKERKKILYGMRKMKEISA